MKPKASDCAWGMAVLILGLGLNLYTPLEVLSSVTLLGIKILSLSLPLTIVFMIWHAGKSVVACV